MKHKKITKIYKLWDNMKTRCYNPKATGYKYYGGKGITVCQEWRNNYLEFYNWAIKNGYKKGLTIDRIENDGNYCPKNCRFVTRLINTRNCSQTKLTIEKVKEIKQLLRKGKLSKKEISKLFNVAEITIFTIKVRRTWKDVLPNYKYPTFKKSSKYKKQYGLYWFEIKEKLGIKNDAKEIEILKKHQEGTLKKYLDSKGIKGVYGIIIKGGQ